MLEGFSKLELGSVEIEIKSGQRVTITWPRYHSLVLVEAVQAPANQILALFSHPHGDQDVAEACRGADNVPLAAFLVSINVVENLFCKLLRMNVSPEDDIVRNPLLDVFVEIVDSSDQMLCRKESP